MRIQRQDLIEAFSWLHYDDPTHTYTDTRSGKRLAGVTTTLESYKPHFDKEYWSKRKAEEWGITQEEVLTMWDNNLSLAIQRGNDHHHPLEEDDPDFLPPSADKYLRECMDENVGKEIRIANEVLGGTFDRLDWRTSVGNILKDYKTNINFQEESEYRLPRPLSHISESHKDIYSLQLSLYRRILEEAGFPIHGMEIIYLARGEYKVIEVPYREWESAYIIDQLRITRDENFRAHRGNSWLTAGSRRRRRTLQ